MRWSLGALAALLLAACAQSYEVEQLEPPAAKLSRGGTVYIVRPEDGRYAGRPYIGSGEKVAWIVYTAFDKHLSHATRADSPAAPQDAMAKARDGGFTYLVAPKILHWEDRQTAWSGLRDVAKVRLEVIEVASGQRLAATVIEGRGTQWTFGGEHPEDTLPEPIAAFVDGLF